jgi:carboxymethylenebutenolidase
VSLSDDLQVTSTWEQLETAQGTMGLYCVQPADGQATSGVVVLQEAFGVNDHIQDVARRVAMNGYLAVAPDLFHRSPTPTVDYADSPTAMARISQLGRAQIDNDVSAACGYLATHHGIPLERTGLVGFCFGGRAAFTAATALPGLAATAVFYGPGVASGEHAVLDRFAGLTGPVLMFVGDQDPTISSADLDAIRAAAAAQHKDVRIEVIPGAGHAFHCDARPQLYRKEAAERAWSAALDFFATALKPRQTV